MCLPDGTLPTGATYSPTARVAEIRWSQPLDTSITPDPARWTVRHVAQLRTGQTAEYVTPRLLRIVFPASSSVSFGADVLMYDGDPVNLQAADGTPVASIPGLPYTVV